MSPLDATADKNLRLALVDEVYCNKHGYDWLAEVPELRDRYETTRHAETEPAWSDLGVEPTHAPTLEVLVLGLAVTAADLAGVTDLTLDGDRVIYGAIWNYWWDLGDHFVIRDLSGLEACPKLGKLHLGQGLVDGASLGPLLRLPALRDLALCHTGAFRDLEVLGQLKLERIWATNVPAGDRRWADELERLREAGTTFR